MVDHFSLKLRQFLSGVKARKHKVLLITDENLATIYSSLLDQMGFETLVLPASESTKSRDYKVYIEDTLFEKGYLKDTELIAFGGGVILDLTGFVASTYMRGVSFSMIPTSVTAFCDASIGGKNGINTLQGKNLIGTFYQPVSVCLEKEFLSTLDKKLFKEQFSEVVKIALTSDRALFFSMDDPMMRARQLKEEVCKHDLFDKGRRQVLNFGHTFAHAYEALTDFEISHGSAVWKGIFFEALLSEKLKILPSDEFEKIRQYFIDHEIDLSFRKNITGEMLYNAMLLDKKNKTRRPYFILLSQIGCVYEANGSCTHGVSRDMILETVAYMEEGVVCGA
jgi:3-dehydroquinate synthase